jgi:hypothetical protein
MTEGRTPKLAQSLLDFDRRKFNLNLFPELTLDLIGLPLSDRWR